MCGFIAQLVEYRTRVVEVSGSNTVDALIFNWKIYCDDILHCDPQPQFKCLNYFIYTSHYCTLHGRYELNKLTLLPMCGFIAH